MEPEYSKRKDDLLRQARDLIAAIAGMEDQIPTVLELLATTPDWAPHFAQARVNQEAFDAYWRDYWRTPRRCSRCGKMGTRRDVTSIEGLASAGSFCAACAEVVKISYRRNCLYCGKEYTAYAVNEYPSLCRECWREEWEGEARRVALQLERAKKSQVAATLNLKQWLATLDFCAWRCAFCGGPFEAMDHYVPIRHGGGTVWSNCLPICKRDNTRKGDVHPDSGALSLLFSPSVLERIAGYLASLPPAA